MVYCCVPGCEKSNKNQIKRCMFSFPKNKDLVEKWLEAIPSLSQPIKSYWRVCQCHFKSEDILEAFSHNIGGEVYLIERERPRLKPNVVPTRNLQINKFNTNRDEQEGNSKNNHIPHVEKQSKHIDLVNKRCIEKLGLTNNQIVPEQQCKRSCIRNDEIIEVQHESTMVDGILKESSEFLENDAEQFESQSIEDITTGSNQILDIDGGTDKLQDKGNVIESNLGDNKNVSPAHCLNSIAEVESFDNLFDNVFEVVLPSTLWGVHRSPHQKRIMFVYVDEEQLNIQKMLIVDDTGDLKIYLMARLIREEKWPVDILTPDRISDMLEELESMQICLGANLSESCEIVLTDDDNDVTQRLCKKCC